MVLFLAMVANHILHLRRKAIWQPTSGISKPQSPNSSPNKMKPHRILAQLVVVADSALNRNPLPAVHLVAAPLIPPPLPRSPRPAGRPRKRSLRP